MVLDEQDLQEGLEFIVGKWQADYVVNAFSNDLAHIPASEFKSSDGRDFSSLCLEFFEDHGAVLSEETSGKEARGSWEQTSFGEYRLTFAEAGETPLGQGALTLSTNDGCLVIGVGFLAVGMKKIAEGTVTKPTDIGDMEPSEEDKQLKGIVGRYEIAKTMAMCGGKFGVFSKAEIMDDLKKRADGGEDVSDEIAEYEKLFTGTFEFTEDHKVISWMKLPEGVGEAELKEAIEAGEIGGAKDGYFYMAPKEWKAVGGKYYYNSEEHRELFGKVQSPWDPIEENEEGLIPFGQGAMMLKKI